MPVNNNCSLKAFRENMEHYIKEEKMEQDQAFAVSMSYLKKACGVKGESRMTPQEVVRRGKQKNMMEEK